MAQLTSHPRLLQGCTKFKHCYAIYLPSSTGTFFVRMMTAQFRWLIKSSDNQSVPRVAGKVQGSQPATRGGSPVHLHLRSFGHLVVIYMKGIMNRHAMTRLQVRHFLVVVINDALESTDFMHDFVSLCFLICLLVCLFFLVLLSLLTKGIGLTGSTFPFNAVQHCWVQNSFGHLVDRYWFNFTFMFSC